VDQKSLGARRWDDLWDRTDGLSKETICEGGWGGLIDRVRCGWVGSGPRGTSGSSMSLVRGLCAQDVGDKHMCSINILMYFKYIFNFFYILNRTLKAGVK
jgi:hypothetical protein